MIYTRLLSRLLGFALAAAIVAGCNPPPEPTPAKPATTAAEPQRVSTPADSDDAFYRTPGGKYTAEDIRANGELSPTEKYKAVANSMGGKAVTGDKICPSTKNKANSQVTWVIGGKTYAFCCPPCIEDFVKTAKEHPDEVKDPAEYVKK